MLNKYVNFELQECSFMEAIKTHEYEKDRVVIFSYAPKDERIFYITLIIDDPKKE